MEQGNWPFRDFIEDSKLKLQHKTSRGSEWTVTWWQRSRWTRKIEPDLEMNRRGDKWSTWSRTDWCQPGFLVDFREVRTKLDASDENGRRFGKKWRQLPVTSEVSQSSESQKIRVSHGGQLKKCSAKWEAQNSLLQLTDVKNHLNPNHSQNSWYFR